MSTLVKLINEVGKRCPNGTLPDSYLVLDIETSGFNYNPPEGKKPDVVVQFGYAAVQQRKLAANDAFLIKRPAGTMSADATRVTGITDELLQTGTPPKEIFPRIYDLLQLYRESGCMFMGHNIVAFDAHFLHYDFEREGISFVFRMSECIDTGMIFKAAQIGLVPNWFESLPQFFSRVRDVRSHAKWNLSLAAETLGIDKKYNLDLHAAHNAGFDCKMTHLVYEELRRRDAL